MSKKEPMLKKKGLPCTVVTCVESLSGFEGGGVKRSLAREKKVGTRRRERNSKRGKREKKNLERKGGGDKYLNYR